MIEFNISIVIVSVIAALVSAYYAMKSYANYKHVNYPVLVPFIVDELHPYTLSLKIENQGNGIAKDIKIKTSISTEKFETDLLPRKFNEFAIITHSESNSFVNGKNPLLNNPNLEITYTDIYGHKLKTVAKFKLDTTPEPKNIGQIDKDFVGLHFIGYKNRWSR